MESLPLGAAVEVEVSRGDDRPSWAGCRLALLAAGDVMLPRAFRVCHGMPYSQNALFTMKFPDLTNTVIEVGVPLAK